MSDAQFKSRHPTEKNTAIYALQENILVYFKSIEGYNL